MREAVIIRAMSHSSPVLAEPQASQHVEKARIPQLNSGNDNSALPATKPG